MAAYRFPLGNVSWDSYIDNLISQSKDKYGKAHTDKVCIIGKEGGAKWTTDRSKHSLKLTHQEAKHIAAAFKSGDFSTFQTHGIWAEGVKYNFLRAVDELILGKKKQDGALTLQGSRTAIICAHCPEGCQQGNQNKAVAVIADYLSTMNL